MNVHCPYSVLTFGIINLRVWKYCSFWSPHCSCQKQEIVKHYIIFHYKSKIRVRVGLVGRSFLFVCLFVCCLIRANNCANKTVLTKQQSQLCSIMSYNSCDPCMTKDVHIRYQCLVSSAGRIHDLHFFCLASVWCFFCVKRLSVGHSIRPKNIWTVT